MAVSLATLIHGSDEINRMGSEINSVVSMILSFVPSYSEAQKLREEIDCSPDPDEPFEGESGLIWTVTRNSPASTKGKMRAVCREGDRVLFATEGDDERAKRVEIVDTLRVHQSLPLFVESMMSFYPKVKTRVEALLEAATQNPSV